MESIFPGLFFLGFLAPIILRSAVAVLFLFDARALWKKSKKKYLALASGVCGLLIAVGLFTQVAVIAAGVQAILLFMRAKNESVFGTRATLLLTLAILLFLLINGPGGLAFDLPY
jgi:hypothetical protein